MPDWDSAVAEALARPEEIQIATRRRDGSLRSPRIIWIVRDGYRVFIRSTNGRDAAWFKGATSSGLAQIRSGSETFDVSLVEVTDEASLAAADRGYRDKYGGYASIVDHLVSVRPRAATLQVLPAALRHDKGH